MTLFRFALAWCGGAFAAAYGFTPWWLPALCGAAFAAGCLLSGRPREASVITVLLLTAIAGALRYEASLVSPQTFNDGEEVVLRGVVAQEPEGRQRSQQVRIKVEAWKDEHGAWTPRDGQVLATVRLFPRYAYGDLVELSGKVETPPRFDGFDYREYLARQGIGAVSLYPTLRRTGSGGGNEIRQAVISLRNSLAAGIEASMPEPEPEASLAAGILLGKRAAIPPEVNDDFNRSGISHLIAISGYNVMLVATFSTGLLWPLIGRRPALLVSMLVIVGYAVLVGGAPSVLRATLMGIVVLGAMLAGRPGRSVGALALTVAGLTAISPRLIDDVSFQLSVLATAGIVIGAQPLAEAVSNIWPGGLRGGAGRFLIDQMSVTAAASVAVLPVMAVTFGRVSLVALPANLAATPAFLLAILSALVAAVAGMADAAFGRVVGEAAHLPLAYLVWLGGFAASAPAASVEVGVLESVAVTTLLAGAAFLLVRRATVEEEALERLRVSFVLASAAALALLAAAVWSQVLSPGEQRLQVTVLDVGQGDAILIETPGGQVILVDGGPSVSRLLNQLGAELPPNRRRIDLVILSHPQDDHVTGLAGLLDRFEVAAVLTGPEEGTSAAYRAWRDGLRQANIPVTHAFTGLSADLGVDLWLEVLGPPLGGVSGGKDDLNENSVVVRLVYGNVSFLLTGDAGFAAEDALLNAGVELRSSVLKVGHHGSDGSTSAAFLEAVGPAIAVISSGEENSFGHPSPTTRLRLGGIPTLRTDLNGRVRFLSDGNRVWVESERGSPEVVSPVQAEK